MSGCGRWPCSPEGCSWDRCPVNEDRDEDDHRDCNECRCDDCQNWTPTEDLKPLLDWRTRNEPSAFDEFLSRLSDEAVSALKFLIEDEAA